MSMDTIMISVRWDGSESPGIISSLWNKNAHDVITEMCWEYAGRVHKQISDIEYVELAVLFGDYRCMHRIDLLSGMGVYSIFSIFRVYAVTLYESIAAEKYGSVLFAVAAAPCDKGDALYQCGSSVKKPSSKERVVACPCCGSGRWHALPMRGKRVVVLCSDCHYSGPAMPSKDSALDKFIIAGGDE